MKKTLKTTLVFVIIAALAFSMVACAGTPSKDEDTNSPGAVSETKESTSGQEKEDSSDNSQTENQEPARDTVNIGVVSDFGTMGPVWASSTPGFCVYETLWAIDKTSDDFEPVLAESWDYVDDTHIVVHVRKGVTDSAGNTFTANDVVYSLNFAKTDMISSFFIQSVDLENTKALDEYTVEIVLTAPNVIQTYNLAEVRMFCQAAMEASGEDKMAGNPVGTGPYVLTSHTTGSLISLTLRDDYWGEAPSIKNVNWLVIPEATQRAVALESGELDLSTEISSTDFLKLSKDDRYETTAISLPTSVNLYYNCSEFSICNDVTVRQAISYAVNKEAIAKLVYDDLCLPSVLPGSQFGFGLDPDWNKETGYYNVDTEKAAALFAQAGIEQGTKIVIGNSGETKETQISEIIQGALMQLGFDVEIISFEPAVWDTVMTDPESGIDIRIKTASSPEGYFTNTVKAKMVMSRSIFYENDELYGLLDEGMQTIEKTQQMAVNKHINDILVQDVPFLSLVDLNNFYAWDKELHGFTDAIEKEWRSWTKILFFLYY